MEHMRKRNSALQKSDLFIIIFDLFKTGCAVFCFHDSINAIRLVSSRLWFSSWCKACLKRHLMGLKADSLSQTHPHTRKSHTDKPLKGLGV